MAHIENGTFLSKKDIQQPVITKKDIIDKFGFDYRSVVVERLKQLNNLPDGHQINFFDMAMRHEGSSGLYLAEEIIGTSWVFVQAMLGKGISTAHIHEEQVAELYVPLEGQSMLNVDGIDQELTSGISFEVNPGQAHFIRTEEEKSCLNLLVMKNSAHIPRNELHKPIGYNHLVSLLGEEKVKNYFPNLLCR